MDTEIEAKFLNIDVAALREKLESLGAKMVYPERPMKRKNFDFPSRSLDKMGGWARVRDEGDKVTMSYKQVDDLTLHGVKEVVVGVSSFEGACSFCAAIGLEEKAYQETKREMWHFGNSEITIDTWPWIPTFVELESQSEEEIKALATKLGFDWKDALHGSVEYAYQKYFDVKPEELYNWKRIAFEPIPDWLEARRKK